MFNRMPFGLTTAPWVFTRLMRAIKKFLRRKGVKVNSFIDDFIVWANSQEKAALHLKWIKLLIKWLGLQINAKKSSLTPVQNLTYLGVDLDLQNLTMSLPAEKVTKLLALVHSTVQQQKVSRAVLEGLIGLITFSHSVIHLGRMHANPRITWMNSHNSVAAHHALVNVTPYLRSLLKPSCQHSFLEQRISFKTPVPNLVLMTDASDYGWSGVILPYCVRDSWSEEDRLRSINEREMIAIQYFVLFMQNTLAGKHVVIHTDSEVVYFCLKRMGSLRCPELMRLVREFLSLCVRRTITFEVQHIRGILNVLADSGSRDKPSAVNNCLDPDTLSYGFYLAGLHTEVAVDLCATVENTRCSRYVSPCQDYNPRCVGWDARRVDWNPYEQIYLFPPVPILEQLFHKIETFPGRGLLIAPYLNGSALASLRSRARHAEPLPDSSFLFQMINGEVVKRPMFFNYWMWVL